MCCVVAEERETINATHLVFLDTAKVSICRLPFLLPKEILWQQPPSLANPYLPPLPCSHPSVASWSLACAPPHRPCVSCPDPSHWLFEPSHSSHPENITFPTSLKFVLQGLCPSCFLSPRESPPSHLLAPLPHPALKDNLGLP